MRPTHGPDPDPGPGLPDRDPDPRDPRHPHVPRRPGPPGSDQPDPPSPDTHIPAGGLGDGPLWTLVRAIDTTAADASPDDGALVRVVARPGAAAASGQLAWLPLGGRHPLDLLLGLVAPADWVALGVCCSGRAYGLDLPGATAGEDTGGGRGVTAGFGSQGPPGATTPPAPVRITMLIDRDGAGAGLLRRGDELIPLPGSPEGTVADACRRALGMPTAPPPGSTAELWTLLWLDRVVEVATTHTTWRGPDAAWAQIMSLHPAVGPAGAAVPRTSAGVADIAARTRLLAAAWPWRRLHEDPSALDAPGLEVPMRLVDWMDDGMWARAVLGALPSAGDLLDAIGALLPPALADQVAAVVDLSVEGGDA